jgi:hypothetical protein
MLADDPSKRGVYTDAHTSCLIPRWRDAATIISSKSASFDILAVAVDEDGTVITPTFVAFSHKMMADDSAE